MSVAIPIPLLQHLPDVNVTPAVGVDEYALVYDHDTARFVLRAPAAPFAGLLATGATVGATAQAQAFTFGVVSPFSAPAADSTTAWQVRKADKTTAVVTVDTTNGRVGIGTTSPYLGLHVAKQYSILTNSDFAVGTVGTVLTSGLGEASGTTYGFIQTTINGDTAYGNTTINPIAGNVGIGTIAPATKLHVVGAATITAGIRPAADSTAALQLQNAAGASVLNVDTVNGRVGIGTATPLRTFHVAGSVYVDGAESNVVWGGGHLWLAGTYNTFRQDTSHNLNLDTYNGGSQITVLSIQQAGNVGICSAVPATRLDIDAGALTMAEMTAPAGAANKGTYYTRDNGSGKTMFCCKLGDDVEIVLATQA